MSARNRSIFERLSLPMALPSIFRTTASFTSYLRGPHAWWWPIRMPFAFGSVLRKRLRGCFSKRPTFPMRANDCRRPGLMETCFGTSPMTIRNPGQHWQMAKALICPDCLRPSFPMQTVHRHGKPLRLLQIGRFLRPLPLYSFYRMNRHRLPKVKMSTSRPILPRPRTPPWPDWSA